VDSRAELNAMKKRKFLTLLGLELRPLDRPARSQSLYQLRYQVQFNTGRNVVNLCLVLCVTNNFTFLGEICSSAVRAGIKIMFVTESILQCSLISK
jgi:hypothetical protein